MEGLLHVPGYLHPCIIYIPTDYRPGILQPLVLYFHGFGGGPTTWPFKAATQEKGCLIVGLSYGAQDDGGEGGFRTDPASLQAMLRFIGDVRQQVQTLYGFNEQQVILAGFSQGGWAVNYFGLCRESKGLYCGYCIIAAGTKEACGFRFMVASDRPVLFINGEFDGNLPFASRGATILGKAGAIVTQVVLAGQGHVPDEPAMVPPLREWLHDCIRRSGA